MVISREAATAALPSRATTSKGPLSRDTISRALPKATISRALLRDKRTTDAAAAELCVPAVLVVLHYYAARPSRSPIVNLLCIAHYSHCSV